MQQAGLLSKLIDLNIVERKNGLALTEEFRSYLESCNQRQYVKLNRIRGWRLILAYFDPALGFLSDMEISEVIRMLEYAGHDQDIQVLL